MSDQDTLRKWIKKQIAPYGRGGQVKLARFIGLEPLKVTYMLNMGTRKQVRNIKADEWLKILLFLEHEGQTPKLPRAMLKSGKAVIVPPATAKVPSPEQVLLNTIFANAEPKQQELILSLLRSVAETYNIPH